MIPTLRPAIRERIQRVSRRDVLRWTGAVSISAGTWVGCETVKIAAERTILDPLLADEPVLPVPHDRLDLGFDEFPASAPASIVLAWQALQMTGTVPEHLGGRCTVLVQGDDDMIVVEQGRETGDIMWGGPLLGPLSRRPDPAFGRWRANCIRAASVRRKPSFGFNHAIANGRPYRYFDLIVPGDRIHVITADESASPARNPRSTADATLRGSA